MSDLTLKSAAMDIPFVPFTFDTVLFCNLAKDLGYDLTWQQADDLWEAYKKGRDSGDIPQPGNTSEAARYMAAQTWWRPETAEQWLTTADAAAQSWWGFGGYFADFGAPGPIAKVTEKIGEVAKGISKAAANVGRNIADGVAQGIGLPKWIIGTVIFGAILIVIFVGVRAYSPKKFARA